MKFHFVKRAKAQESFRVSAMMGKYDLSSVNIVSQFDGDLPIEDMNDWRIGVIFGNSGTGKTQIAKHIFPNNYIIHYDYQASCVIDDMPANASTDDIAMAFNSVGFTTAKSWLKPYSVLSTGEKMRVDLARSLLSDKQLVVFDEFTSVIDRNVARVGAYAIQKAIRRTKEKRFVAVSCHNDIIEWLEADWVFCTDDMTFTDTRRSLRRPAIKIDIHEVKGYWPLFVKYHYMNANILAGSKQFVAFINKEPIAFCAMTHLVHNRINNGMRLHRLVVLPDYQGVGVGGRLLDFCADRFFREGRRVFARFSHPALARSLERNAHWLLVDSGSRSPLHEGIDKMNESGGNRRYTSGWEYVGGNTGKVN